MKTRYLFPCLLAFLSFKSQAQCTLEIRYPDGVLVPFSLKFPSGTSAKVDSNSRIVFGALVLAAGDSDKCTVLFDPPIHWMLYQDQLYLTPLGARSDPHLAINAFPIRRLFRKKGLFTLFLRRKMAAVYD